MEKITDKSGNDYYETGNIRITVVKNTWNNQPGIRIQAYKNEAYKNGQNKSLFPGAELPIPNAGAAFDLIKAIIKALEDCGI